MSAAIEYVDASTHNVGISTEIGIEMQADIEIIVYGGLDSITQELIDNVKEAADRLYREYGIEVVFTPRIVYWDVFIISPGVSADIPVLVINGKEVVRGRSATTEEIIQTALSMLGLREREKPLPIVLRKDEEIVQAAFIA